MSTVTLIVINYNGGYRLRACMESLLSTCDSATKIVLVDNASTDGSLDALDQVLLRDPRLRLVRSHRNRGYAGGLNWGLRDVETAYVGLLNMDLVFHEKWLPPLTQFLDKNPGVAAVSPLIVMKDSGLINAAGQVVNWAGLGFNARHGAVKDAVGKSPFPVGGFHGAAGLFRTEVLKQTGGMDESGFLYHEDVNLSWLLRIMGMEIYCVPESVVEHDYFLSMYPDKLFLLERNRLMMHATHLLPMTFLALLPILIFTEVSVWSFSTLKGASFLRAKAQSYGSLIALRSVISSRRKVVQGLRKQGDCQVLAALSPWYSWQQIVELLVARRSDRVPDGGLPRAAG